MKGLLIKDWYLISQNRKTFIIYLFCCIFMSFSLDISFVCGYISMLLGIIALSTISYDEYDNGMPFMMSLPVDGKTYVTEKFIFCMLLELAGLVTGAVIMTVVPLLKGETVSIIDSILTMIPFVLISTMFIVMMIPIELKYGVERGRVVMMVLYGAVALIGMLVVKIPFPGNVSFVELLAKIPAALLFSAICATAVIVIVIVYLISVRIMENKEF